MTSGKETESKDKCSVVTNDVTTGPIETVKKPQTSMDFSIKGSCELDRSCSDSDPEQSCCE